jgi:hypothetical protein
MRRALVGLCLAGAAGLWAWALFWPKEPLPLPEELRGEFVLFRYEPPQQGDGVNPYPPGQERRFLFGADNHYRIRVIVSGGYEMRRQEGTLMVESDKTLRMTQVSMDRVEERDGPWRYATIWGRDETGPYLQLREVDRGYSLYLRRR